MFHKRPMSNPVNTQQMAANAQIGSAIHPEMANA